MGSKRSIQELAGAAVAEAEVLADAGFAGLIVENMHDRPYVNGPHGPELVAAMTRVCLAVREAAPNLVMGVQVLSAGEREALAVAHACGAQFIRCENFVFSQVADEGLMARGVAGDLLRYRRHIGAESVKVFADIDKKHASHALTADLSMTDWAEAAEFFGVDGVIVTGKSTGKASSVEQVAEVRRATRLPVLVGSGVTPAQVGELFQHSDALIVGTWIKNEGVWTNPVDAARCKALIEAARAVPKVGANP